MLGLPKSTEVSKQLPKTAIYAKFNMNTAAKEKFDADISRINIVAEISPNTVSVSKGETVSMIFVLQVILKHKDFDPKTISQISKLIDQNILLLLECDNEIKLAVFHTKLMQSNWMSADNCSVSLTGLNLDTVWENLITQVGSIEIEQGHSLDEQIAVDEQKAKLQKEIARLEKRVHKEKQLNVQIKLNGELRNLKRKLGAF